MGSPVDKSWKSGRPLLGQSLTALSQRGLLISYHLFSLTHSFLRLPFPCPTFEHCLIPMPLNTLSKSTLSDSFCPTEWAKSSLSHYFTRPVFVFIFLDGNSRFEYRTCCNLDANLVVCVSTPTT